MKISTAFVEDGSSGRSPPFEQGKQSSLAVTSEKGCSSELRWNEDYGFGGQLASANMANHDTLFKSVMMPIGIYVRPAGLDFSKDSEVTQLVLVRLHLK